MRQYLRVLGSMTMLAGLAACKDLSATLPSGVNDPSQYKNLAGAIGMANSARYNFQLTFRETVWSTAIMTDEMISQGYTSGRGYFNDYVGFDVRYRNMKTDNLYAMLQNIRALALQARSQFAAYAPGQQSWTRGEMFAYEGMAELHLADIYCSGVPLSTVDFNGDYTYAPSSTTAQVYQHAITLFDSAIVLAGDSARIATLARIGKARVLLALGQYDAADAVAAQVDVNAQFQLPVYVPAQYGYSDPLWLLWYRAGTPIDSEANIGKPFLTSRDPRIRVVPAPYGLTIGSYPVYTPKDSLIWKIASGTEARLDQAEVALHAGRSSWLTILNELRGNGTTYSRIDTSYVIRPPYSPPNYNNPTPDTTARYIDTLWTAGTGGVAGLKPLVDPGNADARIDLLFRERAFWLYLTGTRQTDLRRLMRNYGRSINATYPMGPYPAGNGIYENDVDIVLPDAESKNPNFHGCLARGE